MKMKVYAHSGQQVSLAPLGTLCAPRPAALLDAVANFTAAARLQQVPARSPDCLHVCCNNLPTLLLASFGIVREIIVRHSKYYDDGVNKNEMIHINIFLYIKEIYRYEQSSKSQ